VGGDIDPGGEVLYMYIWGREVFSWSLGAMRG